MKYIYTLVLFFFSFNGVSQLIIDAESGVAFNTDNEIRFPNSPESQADFVNVPQEFGVSQTGFARLRVSYVFKDKHTVSGLYAPLQFFSFGKLSRPVDFGQSTYLPEEITSVNYKFNSYRLTYRYRIIERPKLRFGIGATGKVRDARIAFSAEDKQDETTDLGFVPLINFNLQYFPTDNITLTLNGDALVGTQGRAEDIFAGIDYRFNKVPVRAKLGYRILEGGADIDQVYNFSLIHYAAFGFIFNLKKK
ncbi:MAG: hypothetical protein NXI10_15590 [bacterium]|nr:hypothetical protein [bacterium]